MQLHLPYSKSVMAIISEVILWTTIALILYAVYSGGRSYEAHHTKNPPQTITLYFKDANQLAGGSPVNFMGTRVGYVTQVKPVGDAIKVVMQTDQKAVKILPGSRFTVAFNGLAGAKSLEVLPPSSKTKPHGLRKYIEEEPLRLKDVLHTQMVLAQALEYSSMNMAHSLGQIKGESNFQRNLKNINQSIHSIDRTLVYYLEKIKYTRNRVHNAVSTATDSIDSFNQALQKIQYVTSPAFFKTNTMSTLRYLTAGTEDVYSSFKRSQEQSRIQTYHLQISRTQSKTNQLYNRLKTFFPGFWSRYSQVNLKLSEFDAFLAHLQSHYFATPAKDRLEKAKIPIGKAKLFSRKLVTPKSKSKP